MNEAYVAAFGDHRPARSAFAVAALPLGAPVEIEAWAWLGLNRRGGGSRSPRLESGGPSGFNGPVLGAI